MIFLWIGLGAAAISAAAILISYICFRMAFYVPKRTIGPEEKIDLPDGEIYEPFHKQMEEWILEARKMKPKKYYIRSFDGLKLCGKYYEYSPDAAIELMFHGYRGNSERDLSGAVQRCFALGRNAFIVDQRASRESEGNVISFGINEHKDCLSWIDFLIKEFGKDVKIIITGISMGASTVLMAAGKNPPKNVVGVLCDCGFTSAKEIIMKVVKQMHLPPKIIYPFIKLGAKLFGRFDLEEYSAIEAAKQCKIPVIFLHGESDDYVPWEMSKKNYDACSSKKELFSVPNAGHGLCYLIDNEGYFNAVREFFK